MHAHSLVRLCKEGPMSLQELQQVVLTKDQPADGLRAGDLGTIVDVGAGGAVFSVEFVTLTGETLNVLLLDPDEIRAVKPGDLAHVRAVDVDVPGTETVRVTG